MGWDIPARGHECPLLNTHTHERRTVATLGTGGGDGGDGGGGGNGGDGGGGGG